MKVTYPVRVKYLKFHMTPSPWINDGKPYADPEDHYMEFDSIEKAEAWVDRGLRGGRICEPHIEIGNFTIEENYL